MLLVWALKSSLSNKRTIQTPPPCSVYMSTALFNLLTPDLQPTFRDDKLKQEYALGRLQVIILQNDGSDVQLERLTTLKFIFQKQLPKMPKEYITRLVYDPLHISVSLAKMSTASSSSSTASGSGQTAMNIVGGITYKPFEEQGFAEIVFCAISSAEQVKGFGGFLMNHVKDFVKKKHPSIKYFLTYADNYAVGYFKKQGFTLEISFDRNKWAGYIKDYEGGTLMQCHMIDGIEYVEQYKLLSAQKRRVVELVDSQCGWSKVHCGLQSCFPIKDPLLIPGVREAGWRTEMAHLKDAPRKGRLYELLRHLMQDLQKHPAAWPFLNPVDLQDVPDYLSVIKQPMDLQTMQQRLESGHYTTMPAFIEDLDLIVTNCRTYNAPDTTYVKNANILEAFFKERLKQRDLTKS